MNWYLKVLKQNLDTSGRARRKEFWMFALFNMIFITVLIILLNFFGIVNEIYKAPGIHIFCLSLTFAVMFPGFGVTIRRLHDIGKSGFMALIVLIPCIGPIWLLVLLFTDSQKGSNKWGQNPKELSA